jgi:hypothetical protein
VWQPVLTSFRGELFHDVCLHVVTPSDKIAREVIDHLSGYLGSDQMHQIMLGAERRESHDVSS